MIKVAAGILVAPKPKSLKKKTIPVVPAVPGTTFTPPAAG